MRRLVTTLIVAFLGRRAARHHNPTLAMVWMLAVIALLAIVGAASRGHTELLPVVAVLAPVTFPWLLARYVFAPLGLWRLAFTFGTMSWLTWSRYGCGGPVAGAYALLRVRKPSDKAMRWLEARANGSVLRPPAVLAGGLLAAARGNTERARDLLGSTERIETCECKEVHKMAREWLAADCAARGDWPALCRLAPTLPSSRATQFLVGVARAFTNKPDKPSRGNLFWLWLLAPARRRTRPLLRLAQDRLDQDRPDRGAPRKQQAPAGATADSEPFRSALDAHVALLSTAPALVEIAAVEQTCRSWDAALCAECVERTVWQRAADLGSNNGATVAADLERTVVTEIAEVVRAAGHPLELYSVASPVWGKCRGQLRDDMLDELELAFGKLESRTDVRRNLPGLDEWAEWLALSRLYAGAAHLCGIELRQTAFPFVHRAACNYAVWLWNDRDQQMIANCIFRWLLDEAIRVGDVEAIELQRKNIEP